MNIILEGGESLSSPEMLKSLESDDPEAPLLRNALHVHQIDVLTATEILLPYEAQGQEGEKKLIVEDDNTSATVATTTSTSSAPVEKEFSPSSIPQVSPQRFGKPPTILEEKHVLHLRSCAVDTISQCYRQVISNNQSTPSSFAVPKPLRNTSHSSSISSNGRNTSHNGSLSSNVRHSSHTSSISSSAPKDNSALLNGEASTFLLLMGPTGSGKSHLVRHALKSLIGTNGYFIRGYWDRLQHPDPYQAYVTAFTDFTAQILRQRRPQKVRALRDTIHETCGAESGVLLEMIPALHVIMDFPDEDDDNCKSLQEKANGVIRDADGTHPSQTSPSRQTESAIQRFVFVFQTFLHAISSLEEPVVLVLDDLQWADPCSIDLLSRILTDRPPGLFVVGTYDGTDMYPEHTLLDTAAPPPSNCSYLVQKLFELERSNAGSVRTVSIRDFDFDQLKYLLDQSLQQSSLFDLQVHDDLCLLVMEETQGNLFLMVQFLQWLLERGLLRTQCPADCGSAFRYWEWNLDDIHQAVRDTTANKNIANGTKYYVSEKLEQLPTGMMDVLKVGACFGNSHMEAQLMEYVLDFPVISILSEAVAMGLLVPLESGYGESQKYCFPHDGLQMAAYHLIPENSRELFHLEMGRRLWRRLGKDDLDRCIFIILSQMLLGRRLITRLPERYSIANLCYHAGRKAAKTSNFRVALTYLNFGIDLLGDRGWRAEYDLSLMMYIAAAEMEVCNANYEGMEALVKSILENGRSAEDKVQAKTLQVYALGVTDRQQLGLDMGRELLNDLGFPFPRRFCKASLRAELKSVQKLLKGKSNDYIGRLSIIEDKDILAALNVLNLMFLHALLVRPNLSPFVTLKMMKLTLTHGLSFLAPLAFGTYGMLCIQMSDRESALRFGELSVQLLERFQVREYIGRVYAAYYACIFPWKYPMRDGLGKLLHAHRIGLQTGDVEFSSLCANLWSYLAIDAGIPLNEIEQQWTNFQVTMKTHRQATVFRMSVPCLQTIQYFQGKDVDFSETEAILQHSLQNKLRSSINGIHWTRAKTAFLFNDYEKAHALTHDANVTRRIWSIPPSPEIAHVVFLNGMISFAMAADQRPQASVKMLRRTQRQHVLEGIKMIRLLKKYALWCPANFLDKKYMLDAELAAANGQSDQAMQYYISAIAMAKDNRSLFVQGVANERAGRYCFTTLNQPQEAVAFFMQALLVYEEWTAHRKVDQLREALKEMYGKEDYQCWFHE